ncbi:NUDIX hydrolase, partial [Candidatus Parcubacteria bacterium]|nr:NUDIX hydrolase [Candidatus Parcubacteria bacterium]
REVLEETGLKVIKITPDIKTKVHSPRDDGAFAFVPFCAQQQIKGGKPWVGFVFLCEVEDTEPVAQKEETKDIRWITISELRDIFEKTPEQIFTLQLGVIDFYLNYQNS